MKRAEAVAILSACAAELRRRFGVDELSLFGSVARDEAGEASDVDVLVSFEHSIPALLKRPRVSREVAW